ncbi:hypothetical protein ACET3Z_003085 [Daucus carota]
MSKQDFMKMQSCVLKVNIHCDGCKNKVKKILQKIDGVCSITINPEQGKVSVIGNVDPLTLLKELEKGGKHAELWGGQKLTNNMMNNLNLFHNMQVPSNGKGGKSNKSQKGGKNQQNNVKQMKGHGNLNLPQKPAKFNMPFDDDEFYDDSESYDDDDGGEFEDEIFDDHHHHKNSVNIKMKPFMCNGQGALGPKNGKKGGLKVKGKSGGKNDGKNNKGGKEKSVFKFTSSLKGLFRKSDEKKCCKESKKGGCHGGKGSHKGSTIKSVGKKGSKDSGGVKNNKSGGLKGGVKKNGKGKKKGDNNGDGAGEGGHSLGSWDHMINNEAINESSFNKSRKGHNGGSGGRNVGHMGQIGDYPINLMGGDSSAHTNLMGLDQMGRMSNHNQRGQMGQVGQMGINQMGQNMNMGPMGQMGNVPAVHGLPAGAGYYQNMGQAWNQYNQQQQQQLAAMMMNQQQAAALHGSGMYHPAMQGRPQAAAMSYGPAMPPPVTINITEYFSDENPNNCSIM